MPTPEEQAANDLKMLHLHQAVERGATIGDFVRVYAAKGDNAATQEEIEEARERYCMGSDNDMEIDTPTLTSRGDDGLWVMGWFWLARPDDDTAEWESSPEVEGPVCHNCRNTTWKHDPETGENHCAACSQVQ